MPRKYIHDPTTSSNQMTIGGSLRTSDPVSIDVIGIIPKRLDRRSWYYFNVYVADLKRRKVLMQERTEKGDNYLVARKTR
mmetsp:Transcript_22973/g.34855  ORF Transcript_22973/g.34855 Transcript_22973/m.34855 type:complete len:80 (-) Transcript_22973:137-376(-)